MQIAKKVLAGLIAAMVFCAGTATAQDVSGVSAETFINAQPIERAAPYYPIGALSARREGWVLVSFVISSTGEVEEPMIEDSSGVEALERATLETVRKWRYSPAMRNGVPVAQSVMKSQIFYRLDKTDGASRTFGNKYRKINTLIEQGDLAAVPPLLDELEFGGRQNLYEDAWFWWLKYAYLDQSKSEDVEQMVNALRLAVGHEEEHLPANVFIVATERLYALQVKQGDLSGAGSTFVRLRDAKTPRRSEAYQPAIDRMSSFQTQIEEALASDRLLAVNAEIGKHEYWVHDLLRRSFSIAGITGRIDAVDIRCSLATKRYDTFPVDGVWHVPESWGKCGVYIKGEPGTTFAFREHPAAATALTLSAD